MSEWKGKIVTCDRCGKECRCRYKGGKELDGGFTYVEMFEEMPEAWKYRHEIGWLCPDCNTTYETLVKNFMEKRPQC